MKPTDMEARANRAGIDPISDCLQLRVLLKELPSLILASVCHLLLPTAALPRPMPWVWAKAVERTLIGVLTPAAHTT